MPKRVKLGRKTTPKDDEDHDEDSGTPARNPSKMSAASQSKTRAGSAKVRGGSGRIVGASARSKVSKKQKSKAKAKISNKAKARAAKRRRESQREEEEEEPEEENDEGEEEEEEGAAELDEEESEEEDEEGEAAIEVVAVKKGARCACCLATFSSNEAEQIFKFHGVGLSSYSTFPHCTGARLGNFEDPPLHFSSCANFCHPPQLLFTCLV